MPISMDEYRTPSWIAAGNLLDKATMSRDNRERFYKFETDLRGWRDGFLQPGFNKNHNSSRVEHTNINNDVITLKGY